MSVACAHAVVFSGQRLEDRATVWIMARRSYSTAELQSRTLKRGARVTLLTDLPGTPAGTEATVAMANGLTWHRYWIRLHDGRVIGHVDHRHLVRSKHYERYIAAREREAEQALSAPAEQASAETEGTATATASEDVVVNGVTIPGYLLERSAAARARLGA